MYIISIHDFLSYTNDNFFDDLYQKYNIERVYANRWINSDAQNRDRIAELLITNNLGWLWTDIEIYLEEYLI